MTYCRSCGHWGHNDFCETCRAAWEREARASESTYPEECMP